MKEGPFVIPHFMFVARYRQGRLPLDVVQAPQCIFECLVFFISATPLFESKLSRSRSSRTIAHQADTKPATLQ